MRYQIYENADHYFGALVSSGKLDVSKLATHVFHGWEHIPEALQLMKDKPADLIKPVVILDNNP